MLMIAVRIDLLITVWLPLTIMALIRTVPLTDPYNICSDVEMF